MDATFDNRVFVRAPAEMVYRWLVDLSAYARWWPGFRLRRAAPAGVSWDAEAAATADAPDGSPPQPGDAAIDFDLVTGRLRRRVRLTARPYRFRVGSGLLLDLDGDLEGTAEWRLEPGWGGTVVAYASRAEVVRRRPAAVAAGYRLSVRRAGWGLKDSLQGEVRDLVGLAP